MQFNKLTILVLAAFLAILSIATTEAAKIQFGKKYSGKATWFDGSDAEDVSFSLIRLITLPCFCVTIILPFFFISAMLYNKQIILPNPYFLSLSLSPSLTNRSHATESWNTRTSMPRTSGTLPP